MYKEIKNVYIMKQPRKRVRKIQAGRTVKSQSRRLGRFK